MRSERGAINKNLLGAGLAKKALGYFQRRRAEKQFLNKIDFNTIARHRHFRTLNDIANDRKATNDFMKQTVKNLRAEYRQKWRKG